MAGAAGNLIARAMRWRNTTTLSSNGGCRTDETPVMGTHRCANRVLYPVPPSTQEDYLMPSTDRLQRKPKLLVILGAGSSIPCGMPSVSDIDKIMKRWSSEVARKPSVDSEGEVFNVLWTASERYYRSNHYGIRPNYERVLGEMTSLASWLSPPPFGNPIIAAISGGAPITAFKWLHNPSDEHACRKLILRHQTSLLEKLANYIRGLSKTLDSRSPPIYNYLNFLRSLRDYFDLGIYNLNYDTVARAAWPEAYCGFDRHGNFEASGVSQRQEWNFVYHLHGSVHHCITAYPHRIGWKEDLAGNFMDRLEMPPDMAQDFRSAPLTTLIAGGFKLDQLLADPYQTFYATLVSHAQQANAVLLAGYGFGDLHVNRALQNRFQRRIDNAPAPPVVILEKSPPDRLQTASRQSHDFWAYQLTHTLNTKFAMTKDHLDRKLTVESLVEDGNFETDVRNQVAIWHGGFVEAMASANKINAWLSRS